ncbi:MAG TPA: glycosyltransferase N-terminal domain-containing protein, partial [Fibrobacteria bacterium]|nr:glycosyltransferase N-terminal domain-containing protein [Fibrobacteria bacterium]
HPAMVARFLADRGVACLCLYEVELWPNYIREASRRRVPVLLVSARLSERATARLGVFPAPWRALLSHMEWIQAQDRLDAERLRALMGGGVPIETGFDYKAAYYLRERPRAEAADSPPREDRIAFVSLHLGELRLLQPYLQDLMKRHALHVFPRLPQEWPAFRAALLPLGFVLHGREADARHVLVDALGLVARELPRCHSAFIGGSLVERGCHNLWEPLLAGAKVYFGPSVFNQEAMARDLLERGLAERLNDPADVLRWHRPSPGFAAAAREYAARRLQDLEAAEVAFRARLEAVLSRFMLFSGP